MAKVNLEFLELITTFRCNSNCGHCLIQPKEVGSEILSSEFAAALITKLAESYELKAINTFGGEPILALETVLKSHRTAREHGIPNRIIQTNGNWTTPIRPAFPYPITQETWNKQGKSLLNREIEIEVLDNRQKQDIQTIASQLADNGVTKVEISVDAFHAEFLSVSQALFAAQSLARKIEEVAFVPRWVISEGAENFPNLLTTKILGQLKEYGIPIERGTTIQPRGNILDSFGEIIPKIEISGKETCQDVPLGVDFQNIREICITPHQEVVFCNNFIVHQGNADEIADFLKNYTPKDFPEIEAILDRGIQGLLDFFPKEQQEEFKAKYYSICDVCFQLRRKLKFAETCQA